MLEKHTYCVKCQLGRTVVGQSPVVMKNGSTALKGQCPSCQSVAYKIVKKDAIHRASSADLQERPRKSPANVFAFALFAIGLAVGGALGLLGGTLF